jgi:hypothetical protein
MGLALWAFAFSTSASAESAQEYYRAALASMQRTVMPAFVTYRTTVPAGRSTMEITRGDDGRAEMEIVSGDSDAQAWDVFYRSSDGFASIRRTDGTHMMSRLALFDPTWRGAFTWLRHGIVSSETTPVTTSEPLPEPAAPGGVIASASPPPIVAIVTAINENNYIVRDGGDDACSEGSPGHRLLLRAKSDPAAHPLTAVVVNDATQRFCSMRFHQRISGPITSIELDIDLHFAQAGAYYLIAGGTVEGTLYHGLEHLPIDTSFVNDDFKFPAALPAGAFAAPGITH